MEEFLKHRKRCVSLKTTQLEEGLIVFLILLYTDNTNESSD